MKVIHPLVYRLILASGFSIWRPCGISGTSSLIFLAVLLCTHLWLLLVVFRNISFFFFVLFEDENQETFSDNNGPEIRLPTNTNTFPNTNIARYAAFQGNTITNSWLLKNCNVSAPHALESCFNVSFAALTCFQPGLESLLPLELYYARITVALFMISRQAVRREESQHQSAFDVRSTSLRSSRWWRAIKSPLRPDPEMFSSNTPGNNLCRVSRNSRFTATALSS